MNSILSCILAISTALGAFVAQSPASAPQKRAAEIPFDENGRVIMQTESDGGEAIYVGKSSNKPEAPCPTDRQPEDYAEFLEGASMPLDKCGKDFDLINTYNPEIFSGTETVIPAEKGTEVYAVQAGTVVEAGYMGSNGYMVKIDHGNGTFTSYAHLSEILVEKGAQVTSGQLIGKVGITGVADCYSLGYTFSEK